MREITLKSIEDSDLGILFKVYVSTRIDEFQLTGWTEEQFIQFLGMQFELQHTQYLQNYKNKSFDIIMYENQPAGRLYINRENDDIRIVDIAVLKEFRNKGIGSFLMKRLLEESDKNNIPLSLHVEYNNPVLNWYEKLGFQKISETGVYYFMKREPLQTK